MRAHGNGLAAQLADRGEVVGERQRLDVRAACRRPRPCAPTPRTPSCTPSTRFHATARPTRRPRRPPTSARRSRARGSRPCRRRSRGPRTAARARVPRIGMPPCLRVQMYCAPCGETTSTPSPSSKRRSSPAPRTWPGRHPHRPGPPVHPLVQPLAVPHRPPRHRHAADRRARRARHRVGAERADPAPALERAAAAHAAACAPGERQVRRPAGIRSAPSVSSAHDILAAAD